MKITQAFGLDLSQHEIDFVDIDTATDTPLFLDPFFLGIRLDSWSIASSRTLRNFFQTFVNLVREDQHRRARAMLDHLHEPNETCLGLSRGDPQGRAIGEINADELFASILQSQAISTGVVEDLEDFRIFIPGIDKDKVSDLTTNIIRRHLINYTISQCDLWKIPLAENRPTGFYWDPGQRRWVNGYNRALIVEGKRILLTPKGVVSFVKKYTPEKYFSKFILEYLQHEHLAMESALVQYRKNGTPYVTKVSLRESVAPYSKSYLAEFTANHPEVFADFRAWVERNSASVRSDEIADEDGSVVAGFLMQKLAELPPGGENASAYHRLCVSILELLLYPLLTAPVVEAEINDGRKRIDIIFDNAATSGFFHRVHNVAQIPAQFICVECKNYTKDVANPELDQLIGRFSVNTGKVGLLVFREVDDLPRLFARCSDALLAGQGLIIPISDSDFMSLLTAYAEGRTQRVDEFFANRYREISFRQP